MKTIALAAAATVLLSGAQFAFAADTHTKSTATKKELTKDEAQAIASKAVPGDVLGWDKEVEEGKTVYEFDIKTAKDSVREVEVSAKSGKIEPGKTVEIEESGNGVNRKTTNAEDLALWKKAKVSREDAEKAALAKVAGGKVTQWESEVENGRPQYEFLVESSKGKQIVEVNALTGKVSETEEYLEGNAI